MTVCQTITEGVFAISGNGPGRGVEKRAGGKESKLNG